jgi:hypothetical protein
MALLSKGAIFGGDDRQYEVVPVPEWNHLAPEGQDAEVRLRSLTGTERDDYEGSMIEQRGKKVKANIRNMRAKLVALSACDEAGEPLFDQADVMRLGQANAAALDRLYEAACRLSGLSDDDVKELEEGFEQAPNGASTSASRPTSDARPSPPSSAASPHANSPSGWPTNGTPAPSAPNAQISTQR